MLVEALGGVGCAAAGLLAYAVRGRSSRLLGPSFWKGPADRRAIALTFDDGPSESTPDLLSLLYDYNVNATFFQCGHHARRLSRVAERCASQGHEIGNHSDTHPAFYLRSPQFIFDQIQRAQTAISEATGVTPTLFRSPYGARWFGLRPALERLELTEVMWTAIARDWSLPAPAIVARMERRAAPGAILCFHDGRELLHPPRHHTHHRCAEGAAAALDRCRLRIPYRQPALQPAGQSPNRSLSSFRRSRATVISVFFASRRRRIIRPPNQG